MPEGRFGASRLAKSPPRSADYQAVDYSLYAVHASYRLDSNLAFVKRIHFTGQCHRVLSHIDCQGAQLGVVAGRELSGDA
jgi:hypothetical protein